jgi:quinol monooxygenase YgiN
MITITAVIKVKPGHEEAMKQALLAVARSVEESEPDTLGYHVSQSLDEPGLFATYERFRDKSAMERHNASPAVARWVETCAPILAEKPVLYVAHEVFAK